MYDRIFLSKLPLMKSTHFSNIFLVSKIFISELLSCFKILIFIIFLNYDLNIYFNEIIQPIMINISHNIFNENVSCLLINLTKYIYITKIPVLKMWVSMFLLKLTIYLNYFIKLNVA